MLSFMIFRPAKLVRNVAGGLCTHNSTMAAVSGGNGSEKLSRHSGTSAA